MHIIDLNPIGKGEKVKENNYGIGPRIKELREDRGLSQERFGERIGVTQQYVGALEMGKRFPGPALVFMISKKFRVKERWLKTGQETI